MRTIFFEWDDKKNQENLSKHGVAFKLTRYAFFDPKRIIAEVPAYRGLKVSAGPRLAKSLGLPAIRQRCPHFDAWLTRLEKLAVE